VVEDSKRSHLREGATLQFFVPIEMALPTATGSPALFVRTARKTSEELRALTGLLQNMVPVYGRPSVQPLEELVGSQVREWRLASIVLNTYSMLAVVVTVLSLTGALALVAEQRRHEFGVRRALGASRAHLVTTLTRSFGAALIGGAVMAGGTTIVAWDRVSQLLFRVTTTDIGAAIAVAGITLACAFAIATIVGLVTTRGQPAHILRS
jgi:predicted lysophospholipase L1 biosynthesis ABC-type transport system permease subunit